MLPLKVDRKAILLFDLNVEEIYAQICEEKNLLLATTHINPKAREFLTELPPRLLRTAAKTLTKNSHVTAYKFVREGCTLEIWKEDKDSRIVHLRAT